MKTNRVRAMVHAWGAAVAVVLFATAAQAGSAIGTLQGQAAGGATIYLNTGANLTLTGINTDDGDTLTVWVDGVQVATTPPSPLFSAGNAFSCTFNSPSSGVVESVQVKANHLGTDFPSVAQNYLVDTTAPNAPAIHWSSPVDGAFMSTGLGNISATATDTGGSGVDIANCTITVSGVPGTTGNNGLDQVFFTPSGGWNVFASNTTYTVTVTVRDHAGNVTSGNSSFVYDKTAPAAPVIHWSSPVDGAFMSTGLGNISATATDTGGSAVDLANCALTVSGIPGTTGNNGSDQIFFTPAGGWNAFVTNTNYTLTATIRDRAGNVSTASRSFWYDNTAPTVPAIHWSSPVDSAFISTGLGNISGTATDAGGSGLDFANCTITVGGIPGITGNNAVNQVFFTPSGGWNAFVTNTTYTITATMVDRAGNVSTNTASFLYDKTAPAAPAIHWSSPVDGAFMSTNLGNISATATDVGGGSSGVDFPNCTLTVTGIAGTTGNNAVDTIFFTPTLGWNAFVTNTNYTLTATIKDKAGNVSTASRSFLYDSTPPTVPVIHWNAPLDNPNWMGVQLSAIYANYTDAGGSAIDTVATTITVTGIPGTKAAIATQVNFTPAGPGNYTSRFVTGQSYTINVTAYDRAGNSASNSKFFSFDGNSPDATAIHWTDPADLIYAGPQLNRIWAANVNDTGGSGLDWNPLNTTVTVGGIARTTSHTPNTIDFLPTNGWPTTWVPKDFVNNTLYTVSATIYDLAGNHRTDTRQFRCDLQAPTATLFWNNPDRGNPPSYFMGQGLNRIWAVLNGTVTTTNGFDPIDYSNTSTSMGIAPLPSAGSQLVSPNTVEWSIVPAANYPTSFAKDQLYTVTANLADMAGNTGSASASFRKDEDKPLVNNVLISNPLTSIFNDNVMLRGSAFPLNPNTFTSSLTDSPAAWGGHTSLDGNGVSYHYLATALPSDMRIYHESAGLVNTSTAFSGASFNYQGFLTLPAGYTPLEGVYAVSVTARDWANTTLSTPAADHETTTTSHLLVDNTAPTETAVGPPLGPYYVNTNRTYLRSGDLNIYPGNVTVTASDTPADRGWNFGRRLNFATSTVTLLNPDGVSRALNAQTWAQPAPVTDLNNLFTSIISPYHNNPFGNDNPIYPRPEYIGNTVEGRYTVRLHLEDRITPGLGVPNVRNIDYFFFDDVTPPRLVSWSPFSTYPVPDSYTSSFSDVQATIVDPALRDGFPGAGLNLPACNAWLYMALADSAHPTGVWSTAAGGPGSGTIVSSGPFVGPQGQSLNNQTVYAMKVAFVINPGRKIYMEGGKHSAVIDNAGAISFTGLDPSSDYVVGWQIPSTYAQDGVSVIGTIPNTAILKNGAYFANFAVADMVGNTAQVESTNFNYLSAGGAIYLSVTPTVILADGVATAVVTTTPVHLSDNPNAVVQDGTEVTVSSTLGDIITPDTDTILPGVQLATVGGVVSFTIRSRPSQAGWTVLRAKSVSGFADSGDVPGMLQMILAKLDHGTVAVVPATENAPARYTLTGNINPILPLTAGVDKFMVDFPAGMILPAIVPAGSVLVNQTPAAAVTVSGQRLTVVTPLTLAAGSAFSLVLPPASGMVNPRAGHYTLNVQSSQDVGALTLPYNIVISIDDQDVVPAPNPCKTGKMRFFFNLSGPARVELLVLNLLGDKVSRVEQDYSAAMQGEALDWNCAHVGPGVYWAQVKIDYTGGAHVKLKKKKIVIIQ